MRKFLIRWWYTANWPQEQHERAMRAWNHAPLIEALQECVYRTVGIWPSCYR